ncbi:hypothetical protein J3Q64DRAFT_1696573 [Phycomyces blakesleeanus]|uniref:Uncharacterized protein n=2 Tax=Phycomyces blakesleeanus TaxID=4837 RepID=A0A163AX44_PHYB8|nr:hypothetical protein PHYBLDRAFT_166362 [Phycomyces blakesleeanus NRRL 1555(-)]OAD76391.1 hypothetical protein PHYBLDRAFT_166362 [Phycomyces blakesleeanus NRRL 1555(-)]|eukprot:XP_018294431.1 hypothetical protein PHYBLDRAFT_166362 [Phycomyces blakesleeanus NRRL 1555(-)]
MYRSVECKSILFHFRYSHWMGSMTLQTQNTHRFAFLEVPVVFVQRERQCPVDKIYESINIRKEISIKKPISNNVKVFLRLIEECHVEKDHDIFRAWCQFSILKYYTLSPYSSGISGLFLTQFRTVSREKSTSTLSIDSRAIFFCVWVDHENAEATMQMQYFKTFLITSNLDLKTTAINSFLTTSAIMLVIPFLDRFFFLGAVKQALN